jgi:hypothetical protein
MAKQFNEPGLFIGLPTKERWANLLPNYPWPMYYGLISPDWELRGEDKPTGIYGLRTGYKPGDADAIWYSLAASDPIGVIGHELGHRFIEKEAEYRDPKSVMPGQSLNVWKDILSKMQPDQNQEKGFAEYGYKPRKQILAENKSNGKNPKFKEDLEFLLRLVPEEIMMRSIFNDPKHLISKVGGIDMSLTSEQEYIKNILLNYLTYGPNAGGFK